MRSPVTEQRILVLGTGSIDTRAVALGLLVRGQALVVFLPELQRMPAVHVDLAGTVIVQLGYHVAEQLGVWSLAVIW